MRRANEDMFENPSNFSAKELTCNSNTIQKLLIEYRTWKWLQLSRGTLLRLLGFGNALTLPLLQNTYEIVTQYSFRSHQMQV